MKIIEKKLATKEFISKYKKEIALMKTLVHPYIIQLHGVIEDEERIYQILDYCKGGDLLKEINRRRKTMTRFTEK